MFRTYFLSTLLLLLAGRNTVLGQDRLRGVISGLTDDGKKVSSKSGKNEKDPQFLNIRLDLTVGDRFQNCENIDLTPISNFLNLDKDRGVCGRSLRKRGICNLRSPSKKIIKTCGLMVGLPKQIEERLPSLPPKCLKACREIYDIYCAMCSGFD